MGEVSLLSVFWLSMMMYHFPNLWELLVIRAVGGHLVYSFDYGTYLSGSDACVSPFLSGNGYKNSFADASVDHRPGFMSPCSVLSACWCLCTI